MYILYINVRGDVIFKKIIMHTRTTTMSPSIDVKERRSHLTTDQPPQVMTGNHRASPRTRTRNPLGGKSKVNAPPETTLTAARRGS